MDNLGDDLLQGAGAIAEFMNFKVRKVYALHERGEIPTFKVGGVIHARKSELHVRMSGALKAA